MSYRVSGLVLLLVAAPAHAYVDPGTGTLMVQMLLAALAGGLFYLRTFIDKVKRLFGHGKDPQSVKPEPDDSAES